VLTTAHRFLRLTALLGVTLACLSSPPSVLAQDFSQLEAQLAQHPALEAMRHQSAGFRERAATADALPDPVVENIPNWQDVNARFGAAFDLLGDGSRILAMTSAGSDRIWPGYGAVGAAKAVLEAHVRRLAGLAAGDVEGAPGATGSARGYGGTPPGGRRTGG